MLLFTTQPEIAFSELKIEALEQCVKTLNMPCSSISVFNFEQVVFFPAGIYLLKVSNKNTRARCEICSKLTIKIPERRQWRCSGIFIVTFEHITHLVLVFLLLTLNM